MKGIWKEKIGGFNNKGDKRKKQNRKHTINDSFDYLERQAYRDIPNPRYHWEGEYLDKLFMYNQPVEYRFWGRGTRRRKYGQKMAHGKDRCALKNWLQLGDWNKEIPTHCYSKTISWWVW